MDSLKREEMIVPLEWLHLYGRQKKIYNVKAYFITLIIFCNLESCIYASRMQLQDTVAALRNKTQPRIIPRDNTSDDTSIMTHDATCRSFALRFVVSRQVGPSDL